RCEDAVRALGCKRLDEPITARLQQLAAERGDARAAQAPVRLRRQRQPGGAPQLCAEQTERDVRVRKEALEDPWPLGPELVSVPCGITQEESRRAVRERRRRRQIRVQVLE